MTIQISTKKALLLFLVLGGVAGIAEASVSEGVAAYNLAKYKLALNELTPLAMKGDATAQTYVGLMYAYGRGVPLDHAKSLYWLRLAAEQGDNRAQYAMGVKAASGMGVPKNKIEALKWFRLAADGGNKNAEERLLELTGEIHLKIPVETQLPNKELRDAPDANKIISTTASQLTAGEIESR